MLDCFAIVVVLVLSWLCLSVRYLLSHILGVSVCLLGMGALVYADVLTGSDKSVAPNKLLGDMLCLAGASLLGCSNVGEEFFVKNFSRIEYLGMVGLFGSVISGIQLAIVERVNLASVRWSDYRILLLYGGYTLSMFTFYSLVSVVVERTSATMFNLSILTVNFYTLIFGIFLFKLKFHLLYVVSFVGIIVGLIVYSAKEPHRTEHRPRCSCCCRHDEDEEEDEEMPSLAVRSRANNVQYCPVHGKVILANEATSLVRN